MKKCFIICMQHCNYFLAAVHNRIRKHYSSQRKLLKHKGPVTHFICGVFWAAEWHVRGGGSRKWGRKKKKGTKHTPYTHTYIHIHTHTYLHALKHINRYTSSPTPLRGDGSQTMKAASGGTTQVYQEPHLRHNALYWLVTSEIFKITQEPLCLFLSTQ